MNWKLEKSACNSLSVAGRKSDGPGAKWPAVAINIAIGCFFTRIGATLMACCAPDRFISLYKEAPLYANAREVKTAPVNATMTHQPPAGADTATNDVTHPYTPLIMHHLPRAEQSRLIKIHFGFS